MNSLCFLSRGHILPFVCILILSVPLSTIGQSIPDTLGIHPIGSYQAPSNSIAVVDLQSGNLSLRAPLYSLPQRGESSFSFSLVANSSPFVYSKDCPDNICTYSYSLGLSTESPYRKLGVYATLDQDLELYNNQVTLTTGKTQVNQWIANLRGVIDSSLAQHPLGYDSTLSKLRSTDGSGFLYVPDDPHSYNFTSKGPYSSTLYTSAGIRHVFGGSTLSHSIIDPDGNTITYNFQATGPNAYLQSGYTDTLGRVIPIPDAPSTSLSSRCPQPASLYQAPSRSYDWLVPGPGGSTSTYTFCFTTVKYRTDFLNSSQQPSGQCTNSGVCYYDAVGTFEGVQSVVLPDNSYWMFTYDAADPSTDSSVAFGSVTDIHYPAGATEHFTYETINGCHTGSDLNKRRAVTSRSITTPDGVQRLWSYDYHLPGSGGNNVPFTRSMMDPNSNATVYTFTPQGSVGDCSAYETRRQSYQGSTQGTKLIDVTTVYQSTPDPQSFRYGVTGVFPTSRTTTLDDGSSTTETYAYDVGFTDLQPICDVNGNNCQSGLAPAQITSGTPSFGKQQMYTLLDGTTPVMTAYTRYVWQDQSAYLSNNLLDLPSGVTILNGDDSLAKAVTSSYDEAQYLDASSITVQKGTAASTRGHLTSSTAVLAGSSDSNGVVTATQSVVTHKGWFDTGEVSRVIDGQGNTAAAYLYDVNLGGAFATTVTDAMGNKSTKQFDVNLGKEVAVVDQNGIQTSIAYNDPLGRVTKITRAAGTTVENQSSFTYPSRTVIVRKDDLKTKGDQQLSSVITKDSLGRIASTQDASGNVVDTHYDLVGNKLSVSNPHGPNPASTDGSTVFSHDALGRLTGTTNPDGGARIVQTVGRTLTETDENGHKQVYTQDALSRVARIVEPTGSTVSYGYDAVGLLKGVTYVNATTDVTQTRTFTYDLIGRLTLAQNPETGTICYGQWSGGSVGAGSCQNGYDANGNLLTRTDARGAVTTSSYDALNRLVSKQFSGVGGLSTCFLYDGAGATNPVNTSGRLSAEWTQRGPCAQGASTLPTSGVVSRKIVDQYDPLGRIASQRTCTLSSCSRQHTQVFGYDRAGNLTSFDDGRAGVSFTQNYNATDRLSDLNSSLVDAKDPSSLYHVRAYGAFGVTEGTLGGVMSLGMTYDTRGRIRSNKVTAAVK